MAQKILLIEDDEQVRSMYQLALEAQGFLCTASENGTKGLEMARADKPDLILLDIMMPGLDGYATLSKGYKPIFSSRNYAFQSFHTGRNRQGNGSWGKRLH